MKYCVIIPAAGNSTRFSESEDKLLKLINNKNLLAHTITNFLEDTNCIKIILVVQSKIKNLLLVNDLFKDKKNYLNRWRIFKNTFCISRLFKNYWYKSG
ncbi:2-C-methyl-D-erythritol 4-phosphate cytidylyltransferase [Spiroplasma endosymbiont of Anurida maritima]|uniref:2-C-methyl-D-erythritol 4-phosphate cytidylyltransferase n=1 Tax=Spiroplasma endosymbiont of Anurida maritima TaxID=2967972 RepID=UPI0036D26CE6